MRNMSEFRHDKFCGGRLGTKNCEVTRMQCRVVGACRPPRVRGPVHRAVNEIMVTVTWRVSGHAYTGEVRAAITSYRLVPRRWGEEEQSYPNQV